MKGNGRDLESHSRQHEHECEGGNRSGARLQGDSDRFKAGAPAQAVKQRGSIQETAAAADPTSKYFRAASELRASRFMYPERR